MKAPLSDLEGKYQILAKLREGGMGAIYKVRHRLLEEIRVVKVMKPRLAEDASFGERFLREARAAARLRHPNIAQLYDFTIAGDGTAFIVMEYIDGIDLGELLERETPPPVATVVEIGVQTLDALEFLHRNRMVHRDISPDNLMIRDRPEGGTEVKLIDLGIAKNLEKGAGMTRAGEFLGKFQYASPEHFGGQDGDREVEPRSDLYSLGLVLYELLTGEKPYRGKGFTALTAAHLTQAPRPFEETDPGGRTPPELQSIVHRALAKSPEDRFPDAASMRSALEATRRRPAAGEEGWTLARTAILERDEKRAEASTVVPGSTQDRLDREFPRDAESARELPPSSDPRENSPASHPPARSKALVRVGLSALVLAALGAVLWTMQKWRGPERPTLSVTETAGPRQETPDEIWRIPDEGVPTPDGGAMEGIAAPDPGAGLDGESRLEDMRAAQQAVRSAETGNRSPTEKAEAWRRFLDAYPEDLPETREDDEIRAYARRRRGYWEGRSAAEADRVSGTGNRGSSPEEPRKTAIPSRAPESASRKTRRAPDGAPESAPGEVEPERRPRRVDPAKIRTREEARSFLAEREIPIDRESFRTAMARDDPVAVRLLLLAGPGFRTGVMENLLEEALERERLRVADAFLSAGVEPPGGILEDAAGDGRLILVRFLWERRIGDREEALEEALDEEHWKVARYLVEVAGAPLTAFEDEAEDLLITAAEEGDRDAVAWLIRTGLDVRGDAGEEALEEAESNEHREVAALLRRARNRGER